MTFEFIADRPVLDFLPTVAARGTVDEEKLTTPDDLRAWILESGLLDEAPAVSPDDLHRTRALREALFRLVAALIDDRTSAPEDRALVARAAAAPLPQLRLDGDRLVRTGDLDAALAVLARDCLELHDGPDRTALHWCADETCTRPFVDRSRGHRRRWCGMKGCGDRAKAAAYRERRRAAE